MSQSSPPEAVAEFIAISQQFHQAMLITRSADNKLSARPMVIAQLEDDGDLWFATDVDSGKVEDLTADPQVAVTMSGGGSYVSISGQARVVRDREKIDQLWNESWRLWFPEGKSDPRLALINVTASQGEYWSHSGIERFQFLFDAAKAYATGQRPKMDDAQHAKVKL